MSMIQVNDLTFCYEGSFDPVFEHVSFQLDTDWRLGFIGRNGQGKTTFLQLLMKRYEYSGSITASVEFDYFPFPVEHPENTALQIAEQRLPCLEWWELARELSLLQVPEEALYRPFSTLSSGEQTKLLLALLFLGENRFLLLDEPTNHLDGQAREEIVDYLKRKKGFILVSHDRALLDQCTDHVLVIHKAGIEVQRGNFSTWQQNKERQDQYELVEQQRLKKEIKRLDAAARRTADWSFQLESTKHSASDSGYVGHKAAKMMKRSKTAQRRREQALEEKQKLLRNVDTVETLKLTPLVPHASRLVEAKELSVCYEQRQVCTPVSFCIEPGERIALVGRNGSGKSSILKLITGSDSIPYTGQIHTAGGLILSYVAQETDFLQGSLRTFAEEHKIEESLFYAVLRKLDLPRSQLTKNMEEFSGGQKKKVLLAASLCTPAHLYVWDEPLNFIDVLSRVQIEELLMQYRPTMLFVEHDAAFVERVATRTVTLREG